ncbi:hypothetical protein YC2023_000009 [Brassica napus]
MKKKKEVVASSASQHTDKSYVRMEKQAGWGVASGGVARAPLDSPTALSSLVPSFV